MISDSDCVEHTEVRTNFSISVNNNELLNQIMLL